MLVFKLTLTNIKQYKIDFYLGRPSTTHNNNPSTFNNIYQNKHVRNNQGNRPYRALSIAPID